MNKELPDWYYQTSPDPGYPGIDEKVRKLVYLLRNDGWNTTSSCGHNYEGVIIIDISGEQFGWAQACGGIIYHLRNFLKENGYEHFEITQKIHQWHGHQVEDMLSVKLLSSEWDARWK